LVPPDTVAQFISEFEPYATGFRPFEIRTKRFVMDTYTVSGETRYFAGYELVEDEPLSELNAQLLSYTKFIKSRRRFFLPHLTIAFDDLEERAYYELKEHFDGNSAEVPAGFSWLCDNVALYRESMGRWIAHTVFKAGKAVVSGDAGR
jgi:hypothetical protein